MDNLEQLRHVLQESIRSCKTMLVAYSGGVDSAYLAWEAHQVLGNKMVAVLADSPSLSRRHLRDALDFAEKHCIPLRVVHTLELEQPEYRRNDASRCFHCKDELFRVMENVAAETGIPNIAYGRNLDDQSDFRPGQRAADLHRAVAPLAAAGLHKAHVRDLARAAGLALWDKPASACLSSRIPYGQPVTTATLHQIEAAEEAMMQLGFRQVRVRHHGQVARVEIAWEELESALTLPMFELIHTAVQAAGFLYVALDTKGYVAGGLNALLPVEVLSADKAGNRGS